VTAPRSDVWLGHTRYRDPVDLKKLRFLVAAVDSVGPAPLDILEVGCGSGNISRPLAWLGHRVLATDIDEASLEFMRLQGVPETLELRLAGLTDLPAGRRFHVIIASEVLEHVEDPARALTVFRGALLPGGLVLVTIPNGHGPWEVGQALSPRRAAAPGSCAARTCEMTATPAGGISPGVALAISSCARPGEMPPKA